MENTFKICSCFAFCNAVKGNGRIFYVKLFLELRSPQLLAGFPYDLKIVSLWAGQHSGQHSKFSIHFHSQENDLNYFYTNSV